MQTLQHAGLCLSRALLTRGGATPFNDLVLAQISEMRDAFARFENGYKGEPQRGLSERI